MDDEKKLNFPQEATEAEPVPAENELPLSITVDTKI